MAAVTLSCAADAAKLTYLCRSTFQRHRQSGDGAPDAGSQRSEQLLKCHLDTFLDALLRCTAVVEGRGMEEEACPPGLSSQDAEVLELQEQVSTAAQAVASLRVSTPALISSELARCLEGRGWGADAAAAAPLPGTPSCSGAAAALSPAPAELQGRVVLAVANMSALRARLEEALGRLQRVTEAVEGEARRGPPCTVERAPRGSVLRPAAGAAGGQPSPKLGRAVESGRIATRRRAAKDVQPLPFVLG